MPLEAIYSPSSGQLFFALLWNSEKINKKELVSTLKNTWGGVKETFSPSHFPMTEYYQKEMGKPLQRCFVLMEGRLSRDAFLEIKKEAMEIERKMARNGCRVVNIDPGLICHEQLILISTKPYAHRIYVGENLYVELCYIFANGYFYTLPWTYPDYALAEVKEKFEVWRNKSK